MLSSPHSHHLSTQVWVSTLGLDSSFVPRQLCLHHHWSGVGNPACVQPGLSTRSIPSHVGVSREM